MAAPLVAGVAGLLASQGKSASQIRAAIENTAGQDFRHRNVFL
ncbi:hypothetical protein [Fictibacillus marinisediminis]|nr:hypothetical protein [Fictibacillus marinisediminis]